MPGSSQPLLMSPRRNLKRLLEDTIGPERLEAEQSAAVDMLTRADSEHKLNHRKLYLVLDLDETLAYTKRLPPGETAVGHKIFVRGEPYDMVLRPGLQQFLRVATQNFIVYLYTMGDEDYTHAALGVIDPDRTLFTGGICCWRPSESRTHKNLDRVLCDKRMALIVDDTPDVWADDLANLCLIRRFIGDPKDDSLMRLAFQIQRVHRTYFEGAGTFSLDGPESAPPDVRTVLLSIRGALLSGCSIALTGVAQVDEETLDYHPLCTLVRLYGGQLTLSVDAATHLVARKKDGWQHSGKIRRALARRQTETGFHAVWDHWMLDSICTWDRQPEDPYSIPPASPEARDSAAPASAAPAPSTTVLAERNEGNGGRLSEVDRELLGLDVPTLPTRKRMREPQQQGLSVAREDVCASSGATRMSVAAYLQQKSTSGAEPVATGNEVPASGSVSDDG
uniref:protein-serine/threonine phosphatase n=1 Tax=Prymnesium polylepis TaxID=72548 RepID=A0A7S4ICT8_9EUKA|mmetsp:Transcript_42491/g.117605  ORF Transcript_42491/g.117605 Transcript_42491/m.117605 type:complete len:450 (+) Transcript_42491:53-1402(+)